jgi:uncharacterized membrane protein YccC
VHPLQWLGKRDRDFAALRRAGRAAIAMPAMFAIGDKLIVNPVLATFAAFGSFAMLLLVDFAGPLRERLQAQAALALAGLVLVSLGTLASQSVLLSTVAMGLVGFAVIFAGVVSSVLAGATTSLLLAFILPVTLTGPASSLPDRLEGWAMASGAALIAVGLLWPTPTRGPLRSAATGACKAIAARLRAEVAYVLSDGDEALKRDRDHAIGQSDDALTALRRVFLATPYRPATLSTAGRPIEQLRLVSVELEMAPLRHAIHILPELMVPAMNADPFDPEIFAPLDGKLDVAVSDLVWWASTLARARAASPRL